MSDAYEVLCDSRETDDWHRFRLLGIGASEAAILLGLNPWKSPLQLYAEKTGDLPPPDLSGNEAVEWGNRLEPIVIDAYRERSERLTDRGGLLLRSNHYPWALCTLDGWTAEQEMGPWWPLEAKTTGASGGDQWVDGPPEHYRAQLQWQMLVTDKPKATIACLVGGQKLVWCDEERDPVMQRKLIYAARQFWARVKDREPPAPDGSDSARATIHRLYPEDDGEALVLPAELIDVADELDECKVAEKALRVRKVRAENALKLALGPHQRGALPDGRIVSWATTIRKAYSVNETRSRTLRISKAKQKG